MLLVAWATDRPCQLVKIAPYIATVCYSLTSFFHFVPGLTETATRLPVGALLAANDQAPGLPVAIGTCFALFLIGATWQILRLRKARALAPLSAPQIKPA